MRINLDDTSYGDDEEEIYRYNGELITGDVVETDRDGNVIGLTPVVNGRANGVERAWYSDGTLRLEIPVVNGNATGTSRQWHPNGQLAEERDFDGRGDLVAIRLWAEDGTPLEREPGRAAQ
jgi:antitoxin component YwqK of YwqJK toxin-antitoxin module